MVFRSAAKRSMGMSSPRPTSLSLITCDKSSQFPILPSSSTYPPRSQPRIDCTVYIISRCSWTVCVCHQSPKTFSNSTILGIGSTAVSLSTVQFLFSVRCNLLVVLMASPDYSPSADLPPNTTGRSSQAVSNRRPV